MTVVARHTSSGGQAVLWPLYLYRGQGEVNTGTDQPGVVVQQLHHLRANLIQDYLFNLARIKASEDRELQKEEEAMDGMPTSPFIHKDSISL